MVGRQSFTTDAVNVNEVKLVLLLPDPEANPQQAFHFRGEVQGSMNKQYMAEQPLKQIAFQIYSYLKVYIFRKKPEMRIRFQNFSPSDVSTIIKINLWFTTPKGATPVN